MLTLMIAMGAFVVAVLGCVLLSPNEDREHLMEDVAQSFF